MIRKKKLIQMQDYFVELIRQAVLRERYGDGHVFINRSWDEDVKRMNEHIKHGIGNEQLSDDDLQKRKSAVAFQQRTQQKLAPHREVAIADIEENYMQNEQSKEMYADMMVQSILESVASANYKYTDQEIKRLEDELENAKSTIKQLTDEELLNSSEDYQSVIEKVKAQDRQLEWYEETFSAYEISSWDELDQLIADECERTLPTEQSGFRGHTR